MAAVLLRRNLLEVVAIITEAGGAPNALGAGGGAAPFGWDGGGAAVAVAVVGWCCWW